MGTFLRAAAGAASGGLRLSGRYPTRFFPTPAGSTETRHTPRADLARMLFGEAVRSNEPIIAPPLLHFELVSVVRRKMRREGVSLAEASSILDDMLSLPIDIQDDPELYRLALRLTERYSLSAFDAQFVALSTLTGCDLWLDDERAFTAIAGRLPHIRRLADYQGRR